MVERPVERPGGAREVVGKRRAHRDVDIEVGGEEAEDEALDAERQVVGHEAC